MLSKTKDTLLNQIETIIINDDLPTLQQLLSENFTNPMQIKKFVKERNLLFYAAKNSATNIVKFFINTYKFNVNQKEPQNKWSLLHYSANTLNPELTEFLLSKESINVNLKSSSKNTPLSISIQSFMKNTNEKGVKTILSLLKHHANLDAENSYGVTPLSEFLYGLHFTSHANLSPYVPNVFVTKLKNYLKVLSFITHNNLIPLDSKHTNHYIKTILDTLEKVRKHKLYLEIMSSLSGQFLIRVLQEELNKLCS